MKVKKLSKDIKLPTKAHIGDAGFDVYSPITLVIPPGETTQIKLGLAIEVIIGEVVIMSERSGMAIKYGITSIGNIIDSNYRGEISIILFNSSKSPFLITREDRIGQIIVHKLGDQRIQEVDELTDSDRGDKAHYSSGK